MQHHAEAHDVGWFPDPSRRHRLRYCAQSGWSEWVADGETVGRDPLGPSDIRNARTKVAQYRLSALLLLLGSSSLVFSCATAVARGVGRGLDQTQSVDDPPVNYSSAWLWFWIGISLLVLGITGFVALRVQRSRAHRRSGQS